MLQKLCSNIHGVLTPTHVSTEFQSHTLDGMRDRCYQRNFEEFDKE